VLLGRTRIEPFNAIATAIFFLAILHTFAAARFARLADGWQQREDARARGTGKPAQPSVGAEVLHFFGEVVVHLGFMTWTVATAHDPALFLGGFLIFLGFTKATAAYQGPVDLRGPLLVGFFLGGLVIHGGLQAWWIAPVLSRLSENPLFVTSTILTGFNDNALITYLASLVPNLDNKLKIAVVEGAVTGGGLTVIANAPNPAGQALLSRFVDDAISPLGLFLGATLPTLIAAIAFRL
jgi:hypothetical protein